MKPGGEVQIQQVMRSGKEVLARQSRTFRMASLWLPKRTRDEVAVLYALCRLIDDLADECSDERRAKEQLDKLRRELELREKPRPLVAGFRDIAGRRGLDVAIVHELIDGVSGDLGEVQIQTEKELLRYCYRVAGTVGLMMCAVLGVDDDRARAHAIDLGVAMQLTNICRDVLEDARRGRVYLPAEYLEAVGLTPRQILTEEVDQQALKIVVEQLLELADRYYESGDRGMHYIPARSRFAIILASRTYRAIGLSLRRQKCDVMAGRTVVSAPRKSMWLVVSLWSWMTLSVRNRIHGGDHQTSLHSALRGLPGVEGGQSRR